MAVLYDLARMTTATTGTGTVTLGSAVSKFLSFADAGVTDGDIVTYAITDGSNSEIGRGTYTASGTTLSRSVLKSTNSNAAINLSGSAEVLITASAEDFNDVVSATEDRAFSATEMAQARANIASAALSAMAQQNIVVNGEMRISQQNGTTSMTTGGDYPVDQWNMQITTVAAGFKQNASGPAGYTHFLRSTITTPSASGNCYARQPIEGTRLALSSWGTADARPATLGFWARSSVTGNFRRAIKDDTGTERFTSPFSISAANTWEYKTVDVAGITAGTWATGAVVGGYIEIGTDGTSVGHQNTTSATLDITGVTLLPGLDNLTSTTSPYVQRAYADELIACQRYWQQVRAFIQTPSSGFMSAQQAIVTKRATPSTSISGVTGFEYTAFVVQSVTTTDVSYQLTSSAAAGNASGNIAVNSRM